MFFNSLTYIFFLPIVAVILYLLPGKYQWLWLLVCSAIFYYTISPVFLILFFVLLALNYYLGITIEKSELSKQRLFIISLCANIIVLIFFKYFGFVQSLIIDLNELQEKDQLLSIFLPVGLSFYIFTQLSYLIEVKRGTIRSEKHIGVFASSSLFFPKIMQGPIEKPGNIIPQFKSAKTFSYIMVTDGLKLIIWGFFKKFVVADRLAIYVNAVYDNYEHHTGVTLILATIFYSFQIYADFSGYTDIALGSAKVLGFNLTENFKRPYFSISIREFWSRWHISFSLWLRDYLFLPLATVFAGKVKKERYLGFAAGNWVFFFATIITFAVCGIWHGEGLNFLIWGLTFGIYLTIANWTLGINKKLRKILHVSKKNDIYKVYSIFVTFILVSFAWIFFRAETAKDAFKIVGAIVSFSGPLFIDYQTLTYGVLAIFFLVFIEFKCEKTGRGNLPFLANNWLKEYFAYATLILITLLVGVFDGSQFIYFRF